MPDLHGRHNALSVSLGKTPENSVGINNDLEPLATTLFTTTKKPRQSRHGLGNDMQANHIAPVLRGWRNLSRKDQQYLPASAPGETGEVNEVDPARWDTKQAHEDEPKPANLMEQQKRSQKPQKTTDKVEAWRQRQVLLPSVVKTSD